MAKTTEWGMTCTSLDHSDHGPTHWEYEPRPGHMAIDIIWCGQLCIFNSWWKKKNEFG